MQLLGNACSAYVLCDLDPLALADVQRFAARTNLESRVQTICRDSRSCLYDRIDEWGDETFIHLDPYDVLTEDEYGHSYVQLFFDAATRGVKVFLWYGYDSVEMREAIACWWRSRSDHLTGFGRFEVEMEGFEGLPDDENAGVAGCGVVVGNLSRQSIARIRRDHEVFCKHYRKVEARGRVYRYTGRL